MSTVFLFIARRLKDMVITGDENVFPPEVESLLCGHPEIAEVGIIGVPDEQWGEAIVAVVALKEGACLEPEELCDWATERLAGFRSEIPTTAHSGRCHAQLHAVRVHRASPDLDSPSKSVRSRNWWFRPVCVAIAAQRVFTPASLRYVAMTRC